MVLDGSDNLCLTDTLHCSHQGYLALAETTGHLLKFLKGIASRFLLVIFVDDVSEFSPRGDDTLGEITLCIPPHPLKFFSEIVLEVVVSVLELRQLDVVDFVEVEQRSNLLCSFDPWFIVVKTEINLFE